MRISDWSSDVCSSDLRLQSLRRQDVGQLAVLVADQRDEGAAIGVVFEPLHRRGHVELATLEVDDAVAALMPPAASAHGDPAIVVAATLARKTLGDRKSVV